MITFLSALWKKIYSIPKRPQVGDAFVRLDGFLKRLEEHGLDDERLNLNLGRFYSSRSADEIAEFASKHPERVRILSSQADELLNHQFDLLGSGVFTPTNREKTKFENGYVPIDWYLDPIRNLRFSDKVHHKEWDLYAMRPENADVKYPWELSRCQHFATLAQAARLLKDARYAVEIEDQIQDFMEENPLGYGVNWTCTMDVAIRALNWVLALALIADFESERRDSIYYALYQHADFIFRNLENNYEVTSNHFLSNVVGLYYLSYLFLELPEGQDWHRFCRESLETEIGVQVLEDGSDFESSIPYHRLVSELFLGAARLAAFNKEPLSLAYSTTLQKMLTFLESVIRPDGLMPVIGDSDDGRLHIFTDYGNWQPQDARHIFGPASAMFNVDRWERLAGESGQHESFWWGFDLPSPLEASSLASLSSATEGPWLLNHANAGLAVCGDGSSYLLISNGIVGTGGFGNHKHNDLLSFELCLNKEPIIVDPGSFVYTSDFEARNRFRATASHNTLEINGAEQNEVNPDWIFRMFEKANPEVHACQLERSVFSYKGLHRGYERLENPVTHTRAFQFSFEDKELSITDSMLGNGEFRFVWSFYFAPNIQLELEEHGLVGISGRHSYEFEYCKALKAYIENGKYSPSYGVAVPCSVLRLSYDLPIQESHVSEFSLRERSHRSPT